MSSGSLKTGRSSKLAPAVSGAQSTQSLLLDKVSARTSTPDSEALASSDDEGDHRLDAPQPSAVLPSSHRPVRRSSWLNDTTQSLARPRKGSFASSMSPTTSHPSTPSAEAANGPWGSHASSAVMGRVPAPSTFAWGTGIWNDRKDAPSRLSEVLPSPTSTVPPGAAGNSFFGPDAGLSPMSTSGSREPNTNPQIPFPIPLHPTPKTYRSQSYSVGQMDPEVAPPSTMGSSTVMGRGGRYPSLHHRPSRPSMLSEMANDSSMLDKVKEVEDDDDESTGESLQGSYHQTNESRTIELLARENAMLRQQQQYNARIRPRAPTGSTYLGNGYQLHEPVPEESDYAIDELDEANETGDPFARRSSTRRMSEFGGHAFRTPLGMDSRKLDHMKKAALWTSSPGLFAGDISQSRRHSFANMPTRQGSISSLADSASVLDVSTADSQTPQGFAPNYAGDGNFFASSNNSSIYAAPSHTMQTAFNSPYAPSLALQNQFVNRAPSPHRNTYGMAQPRHNQLLHVVLFKCARADVFYIQEGTGLTVKPGDLVIVEADRGTDLGTVAKDNVDWQAAKEHKEHFAEEHYKWLMMYSQGAAAAHEGVSSAYITAPSGCQPSAIGGMGPPSQHHLQEPSAGELRPKLIKRLAQNHEIHALRDKEGQEAKAKRVCMQKVKDHGLNMEILDAEFQMDWKKLTFYYFADSYINFNSLVTDLFKIYKTRIWMSAINPASFASPTLGIQAPSGIGPGAVGVGRAASSAGDRRQGQHSQEQQQQQQQQQSQQQPQQQQQAFTHQPPSSRVLRQPFAPSFVTDRQISPNSAYPTSGYAYGAGGIFGNARNTMAYNSNLSPAIEGFSTPGFSQPNDFVSIRQRLAASQNMSASASVTQGVPPLAAQDDWTAAAFSGLSLNTN
ncbi:hypothetical protein CDD81_6477 [Ophiocordyceps australis]|uniref:PSP1 C-terminal domain-containing protein n=1 Tax=Ophiocordyceps australis TaxID=1399860 RepID=A0A2C5YGM8_9HYPO|nr:hypothetical protein CDD81_6477 [Ophiocordyceps australis]